MGTSVIPTHLYTGPSRAPCCCGIGSAPLCNETSGTDMLWKSWMTVFPAQAGRRRHTAAVALPPTRTPCPVPRHWYSALDHRHV